MSVGLYTAIDAERETGLGYTDPAGHKEKVFGML